MSMAGGLAMVSAMTASAQTSSAPQGTANRVVTRAGGSATAARWQPVRPVQATQESDVEELPVPSGSQVHSSGRQVPMFSGPMQSYPMGQTEWVEMGETYPHPLDGQVIYEGGEYFPGHEHQSLAGYGATGGCDGLGGSCGGCNSCSGRSWRPCLTICLPEDGWVRMDYLGWFPRSMHLPALATTSVGTVPANQAGVLGRGPTRVLYGDDNVFDSGVSGGRLQVGLWLDPGHRWSVVGDYFELQSRTDSFRSASSGNPILARPFFNVLTGAEDSQLIAYPGLSSGSLAIDVESSFVGGGFHFRRQTNCNTGTGWGLLGDSRSTFQSRSDFLFGYRYVQLDESIQIAEMLNQSTAPNSRFAVRDSFRTLNQFNGLDLGVTYERRRGLWSVDLLAKLALGNTRQRVDIDGDTMINNVMHEGGGLLAQQTNFGTHTRDRFTIMPELGGNLGYSLTDHLTLKVGYSLIFWSNVVRPGDQIDLDLNPNLFPPAIPGGARRPGFEFRDSDFWVQGINFGGEFAW